eukprot:TRINITY_DN8000_c0_g1_i1.p1 TRINITY_DN8000_c0_g1~~TRINITY_DN8000_c0_g1_i1.p1  ORF type:complete len:356 (+),score=70.59 TRINITY_DN8000_c0_g1_i1:73-1140(+)
MVSVIPTNGDSPAKRPRLGGLELPVLNRDEYLAKMKDAMKDCVSIGAMYSSVINGIVKDPELMMMPIHDHAIVRGHAVFDTCSVANGRLYRVDAHLDRHIASAQRARIPLPFGKSPEEAKEKMRQIIGQTVVASGLRDCNVRYYTTAGPGNFGVTPDGCTSAFYVVAFGGLGGGIVKDDQELVGSKEYTVDVPLKPELLATTKSNNYLLNVLTSMASRDKGGRLGVLVDGDGCIAESCVMNAIFITKDKRLITPPFTKILAGTTCRKILELSERLVKEGLLKEISQEVVTMSAAKECVEMMLCAGDHHIVPVTYWDDLAVGDGQVGSVTKRVVALVTDYMRHGAGDHYDLSYPRE